MRKTSTTNKSAMKLTAKQERFAQLVALKGMTYSDALRNAYDVDNAKQERIWVHASTLRANEKVAKRIKELQERAASRLLMSRQQWLEKQEEMILADVRKLFNPQGDVKPITEIEDAEAALIEGIEVIENFTKVGDHAEHTGYTKRLKLAPKRTLLKDYGQARGWLEQDDLPKGPQRIFLRKWVNQEVQHVHIYGPVLDVTPTGSAGRDELPRPPDTMSLGTSAGGAGSSEDAGGGGGEGVGGSDQRAVESVCEPVRVDEPSATAVPRRVPNRVRRRTIMPDLSVSQRPDDNDV